MPLAWSQYTDWPSQGDRPLALASAISHREPVVGAARHRARTCIRLLQVSPMWIRDNACGASSVRSPASWGVVERWGTGQLRRSNFSASILARLEADVASRCSLPWCRKPTRGPSPVGGKSHNTGVAAHINGASDDGPRPAPTMSSAELSAETNGIWCCQGHAKYIDSDLGAAFPAEVLLAYKQLARARAQLEQAGIASPGAGWFDYIESLAGGNLAPGQRIYFSKGTWVAGANATGKTQLLDWVSGMANAVIWTKWAAARRPAQPPSAFALHYYDPADHRLECGISPDEISLTVDGAVTKPVSFPVGIVRVDLEVGHRRDSALEQLALIVGDTAPAVAAVAERRIPGLGQLRRQGDAGLELLAPSGVAVSWPLLSSGERSWIALEIAVAIASIRATRQLTMLVVDEPLARFSPGAAAHVFDLLARPDNAFQTLAVSVSEPPAPRDGWTLVRLSRDSGATRVAQSAPLREGV